MNAASADPRPPSSNPFAPNSANGSEQSESADSEATSEGSGGETSSKAVQDAYTLGDMLSTCGDREEYSGNAGSSLGDEPVVQSHCQPEPRSAKPFQKWMKTLHKRVLRQQEALGYDGGPVTGPHGTWGGHSLAMGPSRRRHSSSESSSFAFVAAAKSASISMASASLWTRSWKTTNRSSHGRRTERSSRASMSGPRVSEDSYRSERQGPVDPGVVERALQRRRILEELISTEENYIGDVQFLMNVYVTILASLPSSPPGLRASVNRNLTDIVELHEEILGELHRVVPDSEYAQLDSAIKRVESNSSTRGHRRWRSLDVIPEGRDRVSWLSDLPGMAAEPQTAAEVAKIFSKRMNRFFIYEEYGAKYELMIKDIAAAQRTFPGWASCQKGLEILASSLNSANNRDDHQSRRRALTIDDLLVKPIQRVCRYPLLFSELLKHTPVIDCPYSHMVIDNTLVRLREATAEINRATNDSRTKSALEKTWILRDRLRFPDQQLDAATKNRIRLFGHIRLCGALHVCWQTKDGVSGQYMVALLFRDWLCLATAGRSDQIYTIQVCIALGNIKVEEVDNGRGLQCHTARHSWKIVFLCDNQLYELILTACSPKEELEWRARLRSSEPNDNPDGQDQTQSDMFGFLALNIKAMGTVFRKPGTIARKVSIHRATTIGPKSPLYQVILKNTSTAKEGPTVSSNSSINRSQSLLTTNSRIPVLAPARAERARLEAMLADVWTRDVLPFPGITARARSEHLVRASASSMMRKLSAVNITGGFTRRSASSVSLQQHKDKGGATGAAAPSFATRLERRTSEGGLPRVVPMTEEGGTSSAPVRSASADPEYGHDGDDTAELDRRASSEADAEADSNGLEMAARPGQRRASAPDEVGRGIKEEQSRSRESVAAAMRTMKEVASQAAASSSRRPSFQHSNMSEKSASLKKAEVEMAMKMEMQTGKDGEALGHGKGEIQGKGEKEESEVRMETGRVLFRSRSLRLSKKKKKRVTKEAGVGRKGAVAEGIRSWFR
ncbi:uncharacterized protein P884DRAFT_315765 [Thermothelomyces heterothallicus CBS 202.75]|uniref:uncharacterized protein n=1 Tax=Thermothelomyces heterothallicus CBS 202.75 TaxID=1149848 RepID=UPI003744AD3A